MSETKFTKGEWVSGSVGVVYSESDVICDSFNNKHNTHLIAAAPEMYEEIESEIEFLRELRSEAHTPYMAALFDNRIADKVNLLAKARGEK